jgi:hypothetical protein
MQNMKDQQTVMKYILGIHNCTSFLSYFPPYVLPLPSVMVFCIYEVPAKQRET